MSVPHKWDHIPASSPQPSKRVLVTPLRVPTLSSVLTPVLDVDHSLILCQPSYPWYVFAYPSHLGIATSTMQTVITCIINTDSVFQRNPGPARRNPTKIIAATCGRFHAVILQEASDHAPHFSDQFVPCTGDTDLAILLNMDTFEPNAAVVAFHEASTSKDTWGMVVLAVRRLLRRPSLSGSSTVTSYSVHLHNLVAKKRDASTGLL